MGIIRQKRRAETRALLLAAGLSVVAERGIEFATLDDIAQTAGFTKGAIYRQFPSKGAFLLALFEQYAAVARSGTGARQASWFIPLTLQFAAQAMRDPLLRRRFAVVLAEAPDGGSPDGQLLKALGRVLPAARLPVSLRSSWPRRCLWGAGSVFAPPCCFASVPGRCGFPT